MKRPRPSPYAQHSRWSAPGPLGERGFDTLPAAPAQLPAVVSGLVLHPQEAALRGIAIPEASRGDAHLRSVGEFLQVLIARDRRSLQIPRKSENRLFGVCRDYALIACSILRSHGIPARLRVGFADYFIPHYLEDHWVCEYRDGNVWRLLDAELVPDVRSRYRIAFEAHDVPRQRFLAAGPAWQAVRSGAYDPQHMGVHAIGIGGLWFGAASLMRDLAALTMNEMMPWDYWGPVRAWGPGSDVSEEWLKRFDALAKALAREPADYQEAVAILEDHPWAALTDTVISYPLGEPAEVVVAPAQRPIAPTQQ
jgi:Transglutaminase-like superfamily